jgi:hypothetical protein
VVCEGSSDAEVVVVLFLWCAVGCQGQEEVSGGRHRF